MRKVAISGAVLEKVADLRAYLTDELTGAADYPLCRFKKWHRLGYRCAVFEKNWVFAYEVFDDGIIIRDMCHTAILKE